MNIFNRKTGKNQIEQFGYKIADLLKFELPQLLEAIVLSKVYGIYFIHKPKGIYISNSYSPKDFEILNRYHKTFFNLTGISVYNIKEQRYNPLKLYYQSDLLTEIQVDNPEYFHVMFDLNKIQRNSIELEHLKFENPDKKIAEQVLKALTKEQLELLELDYSFEIEFEEKLFYTILDMEDGNYVAVDKKGKFYRLNHDHEKRVKLIADNATDFFNIYCGQKSELQKIIYE